MKGLQTFSSISPFTVRTKIEIEPENCDMFQGATAWIRVYDADYDGDDYIDTFSQPLILRPYQYADDSREKRLAPTRGDRPNQ